MHLASITPNHIKAVGALPLSSRQSLAEFSVSTFPLSSIILCISKLTPRVSSCANSADRLHSGQHLCMATNFQGEAAFLSTNRNQGSRHARKWERGLIMQHPRVIRWLLQNAIRAYNDQDKLRTRRDNHITQG